VTADGRTYGSYPSDITWIGHVPALLVYLDAGSYASVSCSRFVISSIPSPTGPGCL
jgi:hypothetical protein